jgi:DNA polymerase-3 subunit delta'
MSWEEWISLQPIAATILARGTRSRRVAHAYLFVGQAGTGKRAVAQHLAKSLFCITQNGDSCGECNQCLRIDSGNHPDLHTLRPDGASIKIDQVRALQKEFSYRGMESLHKVYIIEQADLMTKQAANSLLKFLEEPGSDSTAMLLTENDQSILPTIRSRCQTLRFQEISIERKIEILQQEGLYEPLIRSACHISGDITNARKLCQSEWFAQFRNLMLQLSKDILQRGSYPLVYLNEKIIKNGQGNQGIMIILDLLFLWYRDILFYHLEQLDRLIHIDCLDELQRQAQLLNRTALFQVMDLIMETKQRLNRHVNPQLALERLIIQLQEVKM